MGAPFTWGGAIIAGLAGTLVMTMVMLAGPMMGMPKMDIMGMLGSMVSSDTKVARSFGGMMHLVMGIIFALIYAAIWHAGLGTANWWIGGVFGLVHGLIVSAMMPMMVRMQARRTQTAPAGGTATGRSAMSVNGGTATMSMTPKTIMGLLMGHIVFGVVVALVYAGFTRPI